MRRNEQSSSAKQQRQHLASSDILADGGGAAVCLAPPSHRRCKDNAPIVTVTIGAANNKRNPHDNDDDDDDDADADIDAESPAAPAQTATTTSTTAATRRAPTSAARAQHCERSATGGALAAARAVARRHQEEPRAQARPAKRDAGARTRAAEAARDGHKEARAHRTHERAQSTCCGSGAVSPPPPPPPQQSPAGRTPIAADTTAGGHCDGTAAKHLTPPVEASLALSSPSSSSSQLESGRDRQTTSDASGAAVCPSCCQPRTTTTTTTTTPASAIQRDCCLMVSKEETSVRLESEKGIEQLENSTCAYENETILVVDKVELNAGECKQQVSIKQGSASSEQSNQLQEVKRKSSLGSGESNKCESVEEESRDCELLVEARKTNLNINNKDSKHEAEKKSNHNKKHNAGERKDSLVSHEQVATDGGGDEYGRECGGNERNAEEGEHVSSTSSPANGDEDDDDDGDKEQAQEAGERERSGSAAAVCKHKQAAPGAAQTPPPRRHLPQYLFNGTTFYAQPAQLQHFQQHQQPASSCHPMGLTMSLGPHNLNHHHHHHHQAAAYHMLANPHSTAAAAAAAASAAPYVHWPFDQMAALLVAMAPQAQQQPQLALPPSHLYPPGYYAASPAFAPLVAPRSQAACLPARHQVHPHSQPAMLCLYPQAAVFPAQPAFYGADYPMNLHHPVAAAATTGGGLVFPSQLNNFAQLPASAFLAPMAGTAPTMVAPPQPPVATAQPPLLSAVAEPMLAMSSSQQTQQHQPQPQPLLHAQTSPLGGQSPMPLAQLEPAGANLISLLPIEAQPARTRQAYGMDKVWQDEFEQLFSQFVSSVMWTLVEVETNPDIRQHCDRIIAYKGRYIVRAGALSSTSASDGSTSGRGTTSTRSSNSATPTQVETGLTSPPHQPPLASGDTDERCCSSCCCCPPDEEPLRSRSGDSSGSETSQAQMQARSNDSGCRECSVASSPSPGQLAEEAATDHAVEIAHRESDSSSVSADSCSSAGVGGQVEVGEQEDAIKVEEEEEDEEEEEEEEEEENGDDDKRRQESSVERTGLNYDDEPGKINLQPDCSGKPLPIRFRMFIDSAKVRFCCDNCGHGWTSMKGRVVFWYELFELVGNVSSGVCADASDLQQQRQQIAAEQIHATMGPSRNHLIGYCAYKLFGQQCDICKVEGRFERPMWYPEEVTKVLNNLYNKIGQVYFGFRMPAIDRQRRAGKPKTSHNSSLCQACHDGVCTDRK